MERLDERGIRHSGVKDRGFMDSIYFEDPLGLLIELASYRFEPPFGYTHADVLLEAHKLRVERGDYNIAQEHLADAIEALVRRSRESLSDDRVAEASRTSDTGGDHMATNTLNILKPSVNNLTVRIFVRAAGLDFEEEDVWGKTTSPEYLAKYPAHLTPMLEEEGLPKGSLGESCAIMAVPLQQARPRPTSIPTDPGERAMVDNAMFYLIGTFYPLLTRATYPTLGFGQYAGRGRDVRGGRRDEGEGGEGRRGRARRAARGVPLVLPRRAGRSSAATTRRSRTSAGRRRSSSCARSTTTSRPGPRSTWTRMEETLGEAYSEPAQDVRGYIELREVAERVVAGRLLIRHHRSRGPSLAWP